MKSFILTFLNRPIMSLMILLSFCMLGSIAFSRLPVGLMPNLASPGITIITRYPGVSAEKIQELITIPIERRVSDLSGIQEILSISNEGESKINIVFAHDSDIKIKIIEAMERIDLVSPSFPREVNDPYIVQYDPSDRPAFILSFSSKSMDLRALREYVDRKIKLKFERVEGVSEVFVGGGYEREIQVSVDPAKLVIQKTPTGAISSAVSSGNIFVPGGKLGSHRDLYVYTDAKFSSIQELADLSVPIAPESGEAGKVIRLSQIAQVRDHYRDRDSISRTDGQDRVTVYIQKSGNANTLRLTEECEAIVETLKTDKQINHYVVYNQGMYIRQALHRVMSECVIGGIIAVCILYFFLRRISTTLLIAVVIPGSVLTTFFIMYLARLELNVMSLSGLALGAGMLVDNSVVVSESIDYLRKRGLAILEAAVEGTARVFPEIIASTLCTIIVFAPLLFTEPETRKLYSGLALTVASSLAISLIFSVTILPAFICRFDGGKSEGSAKLGFVELWAKRYRINVRRLFVNPRPGIILSLLLLVLIPILFRTLKKEYMDPTDTGEIEASIDLKTGTHLERTEEIIKDIELKLRKHAAVKEINSKIEKWHGTFHLKLNDEFRNRDSQEIITELQSITDNNEEAFVYYNLASETQGSAELNIDFYGDDARVLKQFARDMSGTIQRRVSGVTQVVLRFREPKGEILLRPNRDKLATSGVTVSDFGGTVRTLLSGAIVTKFYDADREVDVRFRGLESAIATPEDLERLILPLGEKSISVSSVTDSSQGEGETRVYRKNKRICVSITAKLAGKSIDEVAGDIESLFRTTQFPPEVVYGFGNEYKKLLDSQVQMLSAIGVSILIIYLLLGTLFESFIQPLLILITVPLTLTGVLLVFTIFRMPLTMSVYIGMIMLGGIVVSNSIMVVSTINKQLTKARDINRISVMGDVIRAASLRLRPILMTTATSVFGMLPMALDRSEGSNVWRPLALTIASGLSFSLIISLVLVPLASFLFFKSKYSSKPGDQYA